MPNFVYELIIPNLLFFVVIFLIFSILEGAIVLFLQWLEKKTHDWLMVLMLKVYRHYRKVRVMFQGVGLFIAAVVIWLAWSFFVKTAGKPEITVTAIVLLVVITLVYFILTHLRGELSMRKSGDRVLYVALSLVLYFFILVLVDQKFPDYQRFVYKNVVNPAVEQVVSQLDANKKEDLLNQFRAMVKNGQCPFKDYREDKNTNVIHNFIYMTTDFNLKTAKGPSIPDSAVAVLKGKNCTNSTETFLLTDHGVWYWVIDTSKN